MSVIAQELLEDVLRCGGMRFGHIHLCADDVADEVWAAAGTWNDNFGANPNDIVRVAGGVVTDLKRT